MKAQDIDKSIAEAFHIPFMVFFHSGIVFILKSGGWEKKQFQKKRRRPQKSDFQPGNDKKDGTLDIGVSFLKLSIADRDRRNVDKVVAAVRRIDEDERINGLPGVRRIQALDRVSRENAGYANGRGGRPDR